MPIRAHRGEKLRLALSAAAIAIAVLMLITTHAAYAQDRFTKIIEGAGESTVNASGELVNQKRVAVQAEITKRPPSLDELGLKLPPGSKLQVVQTARQLAQYHPVWRVYEFSVSLPRDAFISHFESQGLTFDIHSNLLRFPGSEDFVDGLFGEQISSFRVWRKPKKL